MPLFFDLIPRTDTAKLKFQGRPHKEAKGTWLTETTFSSFCWWPRTVHTGNSRVPKATHWALSWDFLYPWSWLNPQHVYMLNKTIRHKVTYSFFFNLICVIWNSILKTNVASKSHSLPNSPSSQAQPVMYAWRALHSVELTAQDLMHSAELLL